MDNHTAFRNRSINGDLWIKYKSALDTPMRTFYRGKTIFLTGGSGFLGEIWVEKLLRCGVKQIYLLSREKKGKSAAQRLQEMFDGAPFEPIRRDDPKCMDRVRLINGNMRELGIGLSDADRKLLIDTVDIVLHAAADVRFDNPLKDLCLVNLRGTRELLRIAEQMIDLQMFAYISTAFSHCHRLKIAEKFYDAPICPETLIRLAENVDGHAEKEELFEIFQERLITPWPNTYSFTKAVSEELVRDYGQSLPIIVVRPSIVISTHEEPIPGWGDKIYGLNGMLAAAALGFLRIMFFNPKLRAEVVCADLVCNSTLAAIWDRTTQFSIRDLSNEHATNSDEAGKDTEPRVYTIASDSYDLTWGHVAAAMIDLITTYPSRHCLWLPRNNTTQSRFLAFFLVILYHAIPGTMFDLYLSFTKNPQRTMPAYRKCMMFMEKLRFFMTQEWTMEKANMCAVYDRMSSDDHLFFPCDVRKFQWEEFRLNYFLGMFQYIGKDSLDSIDANRKRLRKFQIAHYFVLFFYYAIIGWITYSLGRLFGFNAFVYDWYESMTNAIQQFYYKAVE